MRYPLIALLAVFATGAHAAKERPFIDEPEPPGSSRVQEREPWREQEAPLPPWPKDGDLVKFQLDNPSAAFRYSIDGKNLAVGGDGVVRYTLVAESRSGARNVSFEGIRCTPKGEFRIYAYGAAGRFQPAPATEWQPVSPHDPTDYHRELHRHFLCVPLKFEPRPKKDMIRALRGPINPRQNTGFLPD